MFGKREEKTEDKKEEVAQPVVKTQGTKPGWRPGGILPKLKAKPGFTAAWKDKAKVNRLMEEGWMPMTAEDHIGPPISQNSVTDPAQMSKKNIAYRDLIAMMLPNELKEARDEYFRGENKNAMSGVINDLDNEMDRIGVQTYTPKGQEGRIVIE